MGGMAKRRVAAWAQTVDMDDSTSFQWFLASCYEDLIANRGRWSSAGFQAVVTHRLGTWAKATGGPRGYVGTLIYRLADWFIRNVYGVELPRSAVIGRRLHLPHATGVVVSRQAVIGDDCMLRQGVTIGLFDRGRPRKPPHAPKLGNLVQVGAGAIVVGGVTVGDEARIGPNAVVVTDVPSGGSAFARAAAVMDPLTDEAHHE